MKKRGQSAPAATNAARRQNIPAFREKGIWKIGENFERKGGQAEITKGYNLPVKSIIHAIGFIYGAESALCP